MPATYRVDPEREIVLSEAVGTLTAADLLGHQKRLRADPAFRPSYRQLLDFTGVTRLDVPSEAVRALAREPLFAPGARRAMVVQADWPVMYGLARMFATMRELHGEQVAVFHTIADAWAWLDEPEARGRS